MPILPSVLVPPPPAPIRSASPGELPPPHWVDHSALVHDAPEPERAWVRGAVALASALFATHSGPPPEDRLRWLGAELERFVSALALPSRLLLRASLLATLLLSPLAAGRLRTFARLEHSARMRALERYERSPFGLTLLAVKAALCILWFEHPDVAREIGFDGQPLHAQAPRADDPRPSVDGSVSPDDA